MDTELIKFEMTLNIDPALLQARLTAALAFVNNYRRDTYPLIVSTKYLVPTSFHAIADKNTPFPETAQVGCATSESQIIFARSCLYAYQATNNTDWRDLGINVLQAYVDYFFVDPIPEFEDIWHSHWLCVAYGNVRTKGSQPNTSPLTDPFNFGNFDTLVTFTNGVGTLGAGSNVADVFNVYNGELQFRNVYAPVRDGGTEYGIDYWVSDYALQGQRYRISPNRTMVATTDAIGTIKLTSNYTGTARVCWSDYSGSLISPPSSPRQAQGLIETYPFLSPCVQGNRTRLNTSYNSYWWGWETFELAYYATGDEKWINAANAFKWTARFALFDMPNPSYFYKKEETFQPFRYPGSLVFTTNNGTNPSPTVTSSRETETSRLNFLKLDNGGSVGGSFPTMEFQNIITQVDLLDNVELYLQAATTQETILEIKLSISSDLNDTSQTYTAYWILSSDDVGYREFTFSMVDFIRYDSSVCWHPTITDTPITATTASGGVVESQYVQQVTGNGSPIALNVFMSLNGGSASFVLNNADLINTPPSMRILCSGQVNVRLKDSNDVFWTTNIPDTLNDFITFSPGWEAFSGTGNPGIARIKEIAFVCVSSDAIVMVQYLGNSIDYAPEQIPLPSRAYKASIVSRIKTPHTLWIGDFQPFNNTLDEIPYTPGIVPFSKNVTKVAGGDDIVNHWGSGEVYMGSLSPYYQYIWSDTTQAENQVSLLIEAFDAYTNQSSDRLRGLPSPIYLPAVWDTASFVSFGTKSAATTKRTMGFPLPFFFETEREFVPSIYEFNKFTWEGVDPNASLFVYTARVMESVAAYAYTTGDERAKGLTAQYLQFLLDDYTFRGSNRPLTNVIPVGRPQSNYEYPYSSALIGQTALWANLAGIDTRLTAKIMEISYDYLETQYVSTGVMAGTYSAGQPTFTQGGTTYNQYFPFWHGGIVEYASLTIQNNETIVYPPDTAVDIGIFPSIEPTKILSIKEPTFKAREIRFSDGNRQVLLPRKTPSGKSLSLQYDKVTATELDTFVEFYRIHGTSELFTLPTNVPLLLPYRLYNGSLNYWRLTNELDIETIVSTSTNGVYTFVLNMEVTENLNG